MSWNTPERRVVFAGPPGFSRLPNVTRALLVLTAGAYLAGLLRLVPMLLLTVFPERIWPGFELWRLVTYPLVVLGIFNVLFGLLILWMFGWELETAFGSRRFGLFVLTSVVASAVLGCGVALLFPRAGSVAGAGLSGLLTAMIVAWALLGPNLPANLFGILPMTRKGFALLALVLVVFGELETSRSLAQLVFLLGGLPVAWLFARASRRGGGGTVRPFRRRWNPFRRRRFTVVEDRSGRVH
jgi:membrane associated rhomboid family serine protease